MKRKTVISPRAHVYIFSTRTSVVLYNTPSRHEVYYIKSPFLIPSPYENFSWLAAFKLLSVFDRTFGGNLVVFVIHTLKP